MLNYECSIYWRQGPESAGPPPPPLLFMAHKGARLLSAAGQSTAKYNHSVSPIISTMLQYPEYVHTFSDHVVEADSLLLKSRRGADLVRIVSNRVILLDPAQLDSYTDSNICQATGSIPALLRWAWYDTYTFVQTGSHVLF